MKLGVHNGTIGAALAAADLVFVHRPADFDAGFDAAFVDLGDRVSLVDDYDRLVSDLATKLEPGDRVVFMSNGGFGAVRQRLTLALQSASNA
jgi:UDP-N-acetylmuramate: L-alanyl-gamma-D-glutamyl-meso-diaminopimelate ligase